MNYNKEDQSTATNKIWPKDSAIYQPAEGDGSDNGSKTKKEIVDTVHEHAYNIPVGDEERQHEERIFDQDEIVKIEETQNSNPGKNNNDKQNLHQAK